MTNNHCPAKPAMIAATTPKLEKAVQEFSEKIMNKMREFAETYSMDELTIIHSSILDSWTECPRCEILVCETQHAAYNKVIRTVMLYLNGEFS